MLVVLESTLTSHTLDVEPTHLSILMPMTPPDGLELAVHSAL
jgi:hypothetical protein